MDAWVWYALGVLTPGVLFVAYCIGLLVFLPSSTIESWCACGWKRHPNRHYEPAWLDGALFRLHKRGKRHRIAGAR